MELTPEQKLAKMVCESIQRTMPATIIRWSAGHRDLRSFLHKHHLRAAIDTGPAHTHHTIARDDMRLQRARYQNRRICASVPTTPPQE